MSLDRKDYKTAIPQLDKRLAELEKVGEKGLANFAVLEDLLNKEIAERQRLYLKQDTSINTLVVKMYYNVVAAGTTPTASTAGWSETVPKMDYSNDDKVLWYMSKTFRNGVVIETSTPQKVQLMDGVFTFINSVADANNNWTTIDGGKISTGRIQDNINGYNYFDLDNGTFQLYSSSTKEGVIWSGSSLYIGETTGRHAEVKGGGFFVYSGTDADSTLIAQLGYESGTTSNNGTATKPIFTLGQRSTDANKTTKGNWSVAEGYDNYASGYCSHAEGEHNDATGHWSHAEGKECKANALNAHAGGWLAEAVNQGGFAQGFGVKTNQDWQTVIGKYNAIENGAFLVGNGSSSTRNTIFKVDWNGKIYSNGNEITVDYVSAQGDSGNWYYRKWNSGKFEAWYNSGSTTVTTGTSSGNGWYRNSSEYTINMPSIGISSIKHADITVTTDYANLITSVVHANTSYLGYYVSHLGSLSSETAYISAYVFGTWA